MHALIIKMSELPGYSDKRKASVTLVSSASELKKKKKKDCGKDSDFPGSLLFRLESHWTDFGPC